MQLVRSREIWEVEGFPGVVLKLHSFHSPVVNPMEFLQAWSLELVLESEQLCHLLGRT